MIQIYESEKGYIYNHTRTENPYSMDFHLHNKFEIYFFINGNVNYFIEKSIYVLEYGDLLIMNDQEIHKPTFLTGEPYERIVIHFSPESVQELNSAGYNLLNCFINRPKGENNRICLNKHQIEEIREILYKIERVDSGLYDGKEVLKVSYFLELLVYINRVFSHRYNMMHINSTPEKLVPILDYIDSNLEKDLSLDSLESKFFMNKFYLSRLFKKSTGSNLHEYIIIKRLSLAKKLLLDGCNVTEACTKCGFNDYTNFLRMFKRTIGVSPGKYRSKNMSGI